MVILQRLLLIKIGREFSKLLGPALTLSCVIAAGLSSLIMSQTNLKSLITSQHLTYRELQFADVVIPLVRLPRIALSPLKELDGVQTADCRLSESGQVRLRQENKLIAARFHSLPTHTSLNQVRLMEGRWPHRDAMNEVILTDAFARAWNIHAGDVMNVLIRGKAIRLNITGLGRSAEYVYQAGSAAAIPDDKLFSVWWVHSRILEQTSGLQSACNEVLIKVRNPDAFQSARAAIAMRLRPYGFTDFIPRKRQLSHYFLDSELTQLQAMSLYIPALFIFITLFLLNITMTRVLLTQREIIGTLRAFGFGKYIIMGQAIALSVLCLFPGLILGILLGIWLSKKMFAIYILFYRFAYVSYEIDIMSIVTSLLLCLLTALAGSLFGLIRIFKEQPAVALSPAAPPHTQVSMLDDLPIIGRLNLTMRMSLRNLFRRPLQSFVTALGIALATALLVFARFEEFAIQQMMDTEFILNQRQSHTLYFSRELPQSALYSLIAKLPAGLSESQLSLPVIIQNGLVSRELTLLIRPARETLRAPDLIVQRSLNPNGLTLSKSIAEALHVTRPQRVILKTKEKYPLSFSIEVNQLSENLMGTVASLSAGEYHNIISSLNSFNTVLHKSQRLKSLNDQYLFTQWPMLAGVSEKSFEKKSFEKTMAENIGIFRNYMIAFALLIAVGVLYNNSRIQFAEREREFALMRALGFYEMELTLLFWSDFLILSAAAIPPGLWLGHRILIIIMNAMETEVFRIPVVLTPQTYLWASSVLFLGVILTAVFIQPRIHRLAFISILKTRE
jgi:putative ABC transport system permease protein